MTLEGQRVTLTASISVQITIRSDPPLLEGLLDLVRTRLGVSGCSRGQNRKILAIVVARVVLFHAHWAHWNAHADVAEIDVVSRGRLLELRQYVVFIGKAHPLACRIPDMHVRAAPQRAGSEWRGNIARIQVHCPGR